VRRVLAPLALALLAGCGRQHHKTTPQLPPADRVAFYQLATVDGLVRSRAVVSDERGTIRVSQPDVDDSRRRLAALAPGDKGLKRVRGELLSALAAVAATRPGAPRGALRAAHDVYLELLRYESLHPQVARVVPD